MNHKLKWSVVAAACLAALVIAQLSGSAATYYVSTTGSDTHTGLSTSAAWATIDNGDRNSALHAGDLVLVQPGTYNPAVQSIPTDDFVGYNIGFRHCSGASGNPITYLANGTVQINGTAPWFDVRFMNVNNCVFNGFVISGGEIGLELDGEEGAVSNIEVKNCTFKGEWCGATVRGVTNCSFHNNVIHDVSSSGYGLSKTTTTGEPLPATTY